MKNFSQWAKETHNEDLDNISAEVEAENTKRSGISANYPDGYVRSQYPHKYFNPIAADADYKLEAKPRKGGSDTAAN